jgi:hypothetical protein
MAELGLLLNPHLSNPGTAGVPELLNVGYLRPWHPSQVGDKSSVPSCRATLEAPWSAKRMEPGPWWASCLGAAAPAPPPLLLCMPMSPSSCPGCRRPWQPTEPMDLTPHTLRILNKVIYLETLISCLPVFVQPRRHGTGVIYVTYYGVRGPWQPLLGS